MTDDVTAFRDSNAKSRNEPVKPENAIIIITVLTGVFANSIEYFSYKFNIHWTDN